MQRTLSLLLIAVLSLGLSACGGGSSGNDGSTPAAGASPQLTWDQGNWNQKNWQ